jgi:hypothetical protein
MQYVNRTFGLFDPAKPLVATRQMTLLGHEVAGGDPISELKDANDVQIDSGVLRRLWMTRWADYADDYRPTTELEAHPPEKAWMDEADGVSVTEGENGWYTINATWLGEEGEKVHGAEAAEARAAEVRELGDTKGVTYAHTGGGWYEVKAPWLAEPVKVKGEEAAKAKFEELRKSQIDNPDVEHPEVLITEEGDEYLVTAPWLEGPERFADVTAAEERQKALREAGPPEGWTPSAGDNTGE